MIGENDQQEQSKTYRAGVRFLGTEHPLRSTEKKEWVEEFLIRAVGAYVLKKTPNIPDTALELLLRAVAAVLSGSRSVQPPSKFQSCWDKLRADRPLTDDDRLVIARGLIKTVQKQAAVAKVQELCSEATKKCLEYAEEATTLLASGAVTGGGTRAAAVLADALADRSNLGQSVMLTLLETGKGYVDQLAKLDDLRQFFKAHPDAWTSFLLFGKNEWVKKVMARKWGVKEVWVHTWMTGIRRKLDVVLPPDLWLDPKVHQAHQLAMYSPLDVATFSAACQEKLALVEQQLVQMPAGKARDNLETFVRKLRTLAKPDHAKKVVAILFTEPLLLGWKQLTKKASIIGQVLPGRATRYYSALDAVLSLAVLRQRGGPVIVHSTRVDTLLVPTNCISRPFSTIRRHQHEYEVGATSHDPLVEHPQPVLLVMKYNQVIKRPGNAEEITAQFKDQGYIDLEIPDCKLARLEGVVFSKRQRTAPRATAIVHKAVTVRVYASAKIRQAIKQGAKVNVLRMCPPLGPARKLAVDVILTGPASAFAVMKHLSPWRLQEYQDAIVFLVPQKVCIGDDRNRVSKYVQVFSTGTVISPYLRQLCDEYLALGKQRSVLHRAISKAKVAGQHHRVTKLRREVSLVEHRRVQILKEIKARCSVELGSHLALSRARAATTEDLSFDPEGTTGGLSKAIYNTPDDPVITERAIRNVNAVFPDAHCEAHFIRPDGTSLIHVECSHDPRGRLQRSRGHYDVAPCSECRELVDTHQNSARRVEEQYLTRFYPSDNPSSSFPDAVVGGPSSQ